MEISNLHVLDTDVLDSKDIEPAQLGCKFSAILSGWRTTNKSISNIEVLDNSL